MIVRYNEALKLFFDRFYAVYPSFNCHLWSSKVKVSYTHLSFTS